MRHALTIAISTCLLSLAVNAGVAVAAPIGLPSITKADIYTVAGNGSSGSTGNGGPATSAALNGPNGSVVDAQGNLLIADTQNNVVRVVANENCSTACPYALPSMITGDMYTVAGNGATGSPSNVGDGGPATNAELNGPTDAGVDGSGNLLIADFYHDRIRLVANENCASACPYGLSSMTIGDIYTIAGNGSFGSSGNGVPATSTHLSFPSQAIVDSAGDVLIADYANNTVQLVAEHSCSSACPYDLTSMTVGDMYRIAGDGTPHYAGDGGPATLAELNEPSGIAVDSANNLLIADGGNNAIRVVADENCSGNCPYSLPAMTDGDIYTIVGDGTPNYTGDGGPAAGAELNAPNGVVVDSYGNLIIMDGANNVVRLVAQENCTSASTCPYGLTSMTLGDIYTVAGDGSVGYTGDGGPATQATMDTPASVAIDQYNDLLISDYNNNAIRLVSAETCSSSCALPGSGSPGGGGGPGGSGPAPPSTTPTSPTTPTAPGGVHQTAAPTIAGTPAIGQLLEASVGGWTGTGLTYRYQWLRDGVAIPGATAASYRVSRADSGHKLSVEVVASDGTTSVAAISQTLTALSVDVRGCTAPSGRLTANAIGVVQLGMTRTSARHLVKSTQRLNSYTDNLCLAGGYGIRVGYANATMLGHGTLRRSLSSRIVFATTANPYYSLNGARPGMTVASVTKRLHLSRPITIGPNTWYVIPGASTNHVLKTRHGVIQEIGDLNRSLTRTRSQQGRLLRLF